MRPTPDHRHVDEESDRIIYLGDVRRRRAAKRRSPDHHYLAAAVVTAVLSLVLWLIVVFNLPPGRFLTYVAFFSPLWVFLTAVGSLGAFGIEWKRGYIPSLHVCVRRGILAATAIVVNLGVDAAHMWTWPVAAVSVLVILLLDVASSRAG